MFVNSNTNVTRGTKICLTVIVISIALIRNKNDYMINGFTFGIGGQQQQQKVAYPLFMFAPPNSGYATPEDEPLMLSEEYEPMMEYPGTMRPGRHRENVPFEDLPLDDIDKIDIPWPYFQEIEWHHQWPAPHPHPVDIEDYIESQGRWATVEDEAEMRRDARKGLKDRSKAQEKDKLAHQIMDDTEDDDEDDEFNLATQPQSVDTAAATAASAASSPTGLDFLSETTTDSDDEKGVEAEDDTEESADDDDFLASLGLDADIGIEDQATATTDDDELPELDFDEEEEESDDDAAVEAKEVLVPLDSLNEADELDNKMEEISYDDQDTTSTDDTGFDFGFDDDGDSETTPDADSEEFSW